MTTQTPPITAFVSHDNALTAFERAIASGLLSANTKDANYAGHYMYMGNNNEGKAAFKHSITREYIKY